MSSMSTRDEWIISRAEFSLERLQDMTPKCHIDDAITLCRYLNGEMNAKSAARLITTLARREAIDDPRDRSIIEFRITKLLVDTLMHFYEDHEMILHLVLAIQDLPYDGGIHWSRISFHTSWSNCYFELNTAKGDEKDFDFFKRFGYLEATMYLRGIYGFAEPWAWEVLNSVCMEQKEFECRVHECYQWLKIAGSKLIEDIQPAQVRSFDRAVRGRSDKTYMMEATMYEHWEHWKKRFLQVSHDEDFLSPESRQVAKDCYEIMKGLIMKQPDPVNPARGMNEDVRPIILPTFPPSHPLAALSGLNLSDLRY